MSTFHIVYMLLWGSLSIAAVIIALWHRRDFPWDHYRRFLAEPWRLVTGLAGWGGIALIAPYTGDCTWDYVDASLMAWGTWLTAPFSVGVLYRALRGRERRGWLVYVAIIAWLFSASWCYDGYLVLRDGWYPETWYSNLVASSILYAAGGLMWSLAWTPEAGGHFAFMRPGWPRPEARVPMVRIIMLCLPFMAAVAIPIAWIFLI